ncbi:cytoplasmic tRNA 2-thiolation protein 2 [Peltigera leucophlebia]|nr:cytoplasmic tRNA 2-thiolation protein 2 [Peltigera leucophlebia]
MAEGVSYPHTVPCARCQDLKATLIVRTEHLCESVRLLFFYFQLVAEPEYRRCFMKYVTTKAFKRLEGNSVRSAFNEPPKKLLLPISLGVTSISLLHILDEQFLAHLKRSGRTSYILHILYINHSPLNEKIDHRRCIDLLKERFPLHTYTMLSLEDVFDYELDIEKEILGLQSVTLLTDDKLARLHHLISNLPSATSKADITTILRQTLTVEFAKQHGCQIILYGDSTTRLAERTLSETAKGRGGLLPLLTADGFLSSGLRIAYPMRDLLKKEISTFAAVISPPLTTLICDHGSTGQEYISSRSTTTIDELMSQYFESVEQNFPSIVANVVRTSSKLKAPATNSNAPSCNICKLPVVKQSHHWGGDQNSSLTPSIDVDTTLKHGKAICYGCARSIKTTG